MLINNPFRPTKFEWEKRPIIWLSRRARDLIPSIKPVYISGSRGSGKTTILRSLSSRQIATDPNLRKQHGKRKLSWYGQYLQFNSTFQEQTDGIIEAAGLNGDPQSQYRLFTTYFEITLLSSFLNDLIHFQEIDYLHFSAADEGRACEELTSLLRKFPWANSRNMHSFHDARRLARELQTEFLRPSWDLDQESVREAIGAILPGSVIKFIKDFALRSVRSKEFDDSGVEFFILLDDCEALSAPQQVALNTYIRRTEGVAKWVVSFLSGRFNTSDTSINNTFLTEDDRDLILMNKMSESEFTTFSEQVANLRLTTFLGQLPTYSKTGKPGSFNLEKTFGRSEPYNDLIAQIIKGSEKRELSAFKSEVASTKGMLLKYVNANFIDRFSCGKDQLPYIEHIVLQALDVRVEQYSSPEAQSSLAKTIDGKQAAAYIAFCARYGVKPIYCGANYIKAVSDRSIRDFLDVMAELFDVLSNPRQSQSADVFPRGLHDTAHRFLSGDRIPNSAQSSAILLASQAKYKNLSQLRSSEPQIERLVLSLAHLQAEIERDHNDWFAVKTPTRGRFLVEIPSQTTVEETYSPGKRILELIWRLEFDRYIKVVSNEEKSNFVEVTFALHRRLRPHVSCGYTGPYDPLIPLQLNWLSDILGAGDTFDPEKWGREKYAALKRTNGSSNQMFLPL
ncbi:hypothetical protein CLV79_106191 [Limimaricola soesokkakensis]|uniref:Uncharacterized protein n=2 Tax=Limimaricola soesokkakensis TaxID=1343159 RepID=A0A1X6ZEU2_9RHOB|nr:hypothetical protein CLV79_106191 [Limimaricola soesokkakensis]SLN49412.1 hypothetical protein LOS8367_02189 [Limimaricola soesokkakensis]